MLFLLAMAAMHLQNCMLWQGAMPCKVQHSCMQLAFLLKTLTMLHLPYIALQTRYRQSIASCGVSYHFNCPEKLMSRFALGRTFRIHRLAKPM